MAGQGTPQESPRRPRPRLLVLTSTFPRRPDDTEPAFVFELSRRLAARFEVTVLAPHAPGLPVRDRWDDMDVRRFRYCPEPLETLCYAGGIQAQLRAHPWKHLLVPLFLLGQWWHCRKLLRAERFDVVHAHWLFPQGLIALISGPTPVVVTAHGSDLHSLRGRLFRHLQRYVLRYSHTVTVVSAAMARIAQEILNPIRDLRILPMGVDLQSRFTPSTAPREPATFLFVGRLVASKGLDVLLEAFALLRQDVPTARLVVIGSGPLESDYRNLAGSYGMGDCAHFAGALPAAQLPAWYRRATALVSPSRAEGLGLALIEAAGCACPIIATRLPATQEILDDGESGVLLAAENPRLLAQAMQLVATDLDTARRLGETARERVLARYDWSVSAAGYTLAIEDALPTERRSRA